MNYDEFRYFIFSKTYVAEQLVKFLRKKYNIPEKMSSSDWTGKLLKDHYESFEGKKQVWEKILKRKVEIDSDFVWIVSREIEREITPDITKIAKRLDINEVLFRVLVLYNNVPNKLFSPERVFYCNPLIPIREEGVYIRIDENLSKNEMWGLIKKAKEKIKSLNNDFPSEKRKRKVIAKDDNIKINFYIKVEEKIKELAKEKQKNKYFSEELYPKELVRAAINELTDDLLEKKEYDDKTSDELVPIYTKRIQTYYYEISRRYKLPTPKKLLSILRLLDN